MKKSFAVLLAVSLLFGCFSPGIALEETADDQAISLPFSMEAGFLKSIGVIDGSFDLTASKTRGEFTKLLALMMFPHVDFSTAGNYEGIPFADVPSTHAYYSYIKACRDINVVNGDNENNFYPDREITMPEAVAMLVNVLGYTVYANAYGGYPSGYYVIAREAGITKGVDLSSEKITGSIMAKLFYNALFADLVSIDSVSNSGIQVEIEKTKNILSERLGILEYDATIIDNGLVSMEGVSISDPERVVLTDVKTSDRITVYTGKADISNHLGCRVKAFIKYNEETGRNEVIYYSLHKNTQEILLNADWVIGVTSGYLEYEPEKDSGKYQKVSFGQQPPFVVLNGVHLVHYNWNELVPEDGFIRAVLNENNKAEFIEIISFNLYDGQKGASRNNVVDLADEDDLFINCRLNPSQNLDLNDKDASFRFIMSEGYSTLRDLNKNDIVSVAQSPKKIDGKAFYYLAVSSATADGVVTSASPAEKEIYVDEEGYEVSNSLLSVKKKFIEQISFDQNATFYLDCTGKIAYTENAATTAKNYAYLIGAQLEDSFGDTLNLKLFTKDGEVLTLEARDSVTVDGVRCKNAEEALTRLKTRPEGAKAVSSLSRPVIVDINSDNMVTRIDTDTPNEPDNGELTFYSSQTHIKYSKNETEDEKALKAGYRSPRAGDTKTTKGVSIEGRFYLTSDTVILNVPDVDVYGFDVWQKYATNKQNANLNRAPEEAMAKLYEMPLKDENYQVMYSNSLSNMINYDIQGYDIDPETGIAGLVILRGRTDTYYYGKVPYAASYPMYIFKKKTQVYDTEKEKIITKIYYTMNGTDEYSATADLDDILCFYRFLIEGCQADATPYGKAVTPLKEGDMIRVIAQDGKLTHLERVLHLDNLTESYSAPMYPTSSMLLYSSVLYGMYGMPFDERLYYAGFTNNYGMAVGYCNSLKGSNLSVLLGSAKVSDVDLGDPTSYIEQIFSITGMQFPLIQIDKEGKLEIRTGTLNDIVAVQSNSNNTTGASLIVLKHSDFKADQFFVINDERR